MPGATSFDELHAVDYLVYAYLQRGENEKALALRDKLIAGSGLQRAAEPEEIAAAVGFQVRRW